MDSQPGWLKNYSALAGDEDRRGGDFVDYVAQNDSVSPRVLLALAEYQAGALSQPVLIKLPKISLGLYRSIPSRVLLQLVWAANKLNNGYYGWRNGRLESYTLAMAMEVVDPWQNAASVALQYYYAQLFSSAEYEKAIYDEGFYAVYMNILVIPGKTSSLTFPAISPSLT